MRPRQRDDANIRVGAATTSSTWANGGSDPAASGDPEAATVYYAQPPAWLRYPEACLPPTTERFPEIPIRSDSDMHPQRREQLIHARVAAVNRITMFNALHADEAFQRRYKHQLGPYAVALLFWIPQDSTGRVLRTDRRFYALERRTADPGGLLKALADQVYSGWSTNGFEVRNSLVSHPDELWTPRELRDATFFGVALSSLDDAPGSGSWAQRCRRVAAADDLPTFCMVHCVDGGRLLVRRAGAEGHHAPKRSASVQLNTSGFAPFQWRYDTGLNSIPVDDPAAPVWHQLTELARMIHWGWGQR